MANQLLALDISKAFDRVWQGVFNKLKHCGISGRILHFVSSCLSNKGKFAIPPLFNSQEVFFSASDKLKLLAKNFCFNSNLDDSGISLCALPSRTNLKLHNIFVTPKMVKKIITNLDLSKTSGPDYIAVVLLKNCEPELSYILAELFNNYLKESYFSDCWKVSLEVSVFENFGERSTAKNYHSVSLLSVVCKIGYV